MVIFQKKEKSCRRSLQLFPPELPHFGDGKVAPKAHPCRGQTIEAMRCA